jgi:hypothetical protein
VKKSTRVEENFFRYHIHNLKIIGIKGCVCAIALSLLMVGCTPTKGDETAPTISSVTVEETTITITATDDVGVTGYIVTDNATKPSATSDEWSANPVITVDEVGTYYVWAKDNVGNISNSEEVVIREESVYERLAKDYDHIAWVINPATEKTVDGVVYNLTELKQQYGDLYPIVEPLSEQEIKDRFSYLVDYLLKVTDEEVLSSGLFRIYLGEGFLIELNEFNKNWKNDIATATDPALKRIGDYFVFSVEADQYIIDNYREIFTSSQSNYGIGLDSIENLPINYMELFLRNYSMPVFFEINYIIDKEIEPRFYFDTELDSDN